MARRRHKIVSHANQGTSRGGTLREEKTGPKQVDVSSILKTQHLQRLATWAGGEAGINPLAALLGEHLAATAEDSEIPLNASIILCQRCETVLQPGFNCTVRIEKVTNKKRRAKKSQVSSQNNVVYTCHFCSHRNLKQGTAKGHIQALISSQQGHPSKSNSNNPLNEMEGSFSEEIPVAQELQHNAGSRNPRQPEFKSELNAGTSGAAAGTLSSKSPVTPLMKLVNKSDNKRKVIDSSGAAAGCLSSKSPGTPLMKLVNTSDNKRKVTDSTPNKIGTSSTTSDLGTAFGGSSKRRRKGWSSLKEIVESNESKKDMSISNFSIPFLM